MPKAGKKKSKGQGEGRSIQRRSTATAGKGGPVTLAEAESLARTQIPRPKRVSKQRVPKREMEPLGAEIFIALRDVARARQNLREVYKREQKERIKEYTAIMKLMKKRGVKGLASPSQPLQILAEGDSWFKYPYPKFGGAIIPRLDNLIGVKILNLAKAGDQVQKMMDVEQRAELVDHLQKGCPAGGPWDVLLFSGGGNDVVDNHLEECIKEYDPAIPVENHIEQGKYDAVLALLRKGYEDLIAIRNQSSPTTHLILHAYDFAIPDGRGAVIFGPWLEPAFNLRHFPRRPHLQEKFEVVKAMLQQFAVMLQSLKGPRVTFINAQGTLSPQPSSWHNEMHPERVGFNRFAEIFHAKLKELFPGRVL
jgi:hypothetical protein